LQVAGFDRLHQIRKRLAKLVGGIDLIVVGVLAAGPYGLCRPAAQQAYASLTQLQSNGQGPPANANSPLNQALSQIGQALQNGDISGAQQTLSTLAQQAQGPHHHHHHDHAGSDADSTANAPAPSGIGATVDVTA
jgi:hypothetical protein